MIIFGIDVPLAEILVVLIIICFLILIESIVIVALLMRKIDKLQRINKLTLKYVETLYQLKNKEIEHHKAMGIKCVTHNKK